MQPFFRTVGLAATLVLAALGAAAPAQPVAPAPAAQNADPALWKVADEDTTIYLFGTIHMLPRGLDWFDGPLATAFEQSGELVTEIPEENEAASQAVLLKHGLLPQGQTLRGSMTKPELAKFDATLAKLGVPVTAFDRFRPWYAAVVIATLPLQREGFDLEHGVESELAARAKDRAVPRSGLETLDYQLGLFAAFPPKVQKKYLFEVIDALPTLNSDVKAMVEAWRTGDAKRLADMMNAEEDDPAMVAALLTNRNKAWAAWVRGRLDKPGTVFVAVGAGHLGGKGSVQEQLANAGIAVTRVQ